jgi:hypothetical protein
MSNIFEGDLAKTSRIRLKIIESVAKPIIRSFAVTSVS